MVSVPAKASGGTEPSASGAVEFSVSGATEPSASGAIEFSRSKKSSTKTSLEKKAQDTARMESGATEPKQRKTGTQELVAWNSEPLLECQARGSAHGHYFIWKHSAHEAGPVDGVAVRKSHGRLLEPESF